jgi:putative endonuclease
VLYIGITYDIVVRLYQHRHSQGTFVSKYKVFYLVHLEEYHDYRDGIARETQLKKWRREKKEWLIGLKNPQWVDLSSEWGTEGPVAISPQDPCRAPERSIRRG